MHNELENVFDQLVESLYLHFEVDPSKQLELCLMYVCSQQHTNNQFYSDKLVTRPFSFPDVCI